MGTKRGPSKAKLILQEAMNRVTEAQNKRDELRAALDMAQKVYEVHLDAYRALEKAFTRAPKSPSPAPRAGKKSSSASAPKTAGDPSSETEKGIALGAGANVSGGN